MVRWYVTAGTSDGEMTREPPFPNVTESPEYLGTVAVDPDIGADQPVMHWFTADTANADRRVGARASLFFKGRFYDNIFCRIRGQSTPTGRSTNTSSTFTAAGTFSGKKARRTLRSSTSTRIS